MIKTLQIVALFVLLFSFAGTVNAQDKILTMSGEVISCKIVDDSHIFIEYTVVNKRNKVKERMIHKSEVFSLIKEGEETVIYAKNDFLGDTFTVAETRDFVTGETDGENYHTKRIEILGYTLGAASGYASKANIIVVLLTPTVYTVYQFIPIIKIKEETMSDMKFLGNNNYKHGYEITAKGKRFRKAFQSSAIGTLVGAVIYKLIPYS